MTAPAGLKPVSGSTRRTPRFLLLLAGVFLLARVTLGLVDRTSSGETAGSAGPDSLELVHWVGADSAEALSGLTGKPILYDFAAAWCGPCKLMKREVFMDKEAASFINDSFVPARVIDRAVESGRNTPAVDALQKKYKVRAFPTLVVAGQNVEPVVLEGYAGRAETLSRLRAATVSH